MAGPPFPPAPPQPGMDTYQPEYYEPPRTGTATASLVLGIISIPTTCVCVGPILGIIGIVLGIVGVARASGQPERYAGKGRAVGGIVTGGVSVVLTILLVAMSGSLVAPYMSMFRSAAGLELVARALGDYERANSQYPPDLATLVASGMIARNPMAADADPVAGVYYVPGLKPTDPSDWIIAYSKMDVFGYQMMGVVEVGNTAPYVLPSAEFEAALAKFKREYEEDRGEPPTILAPRGSGEEAKEEAE